MGCSKRDFVPGNMDDDYGDDQHDDEVEAQSQPRYWPMVRI